MINLVLYPIAIFYSTLIFYLALMNVSKYKDTLNTVQTVVFAPILIVGLILDVLFRYTLGTLLKLPNFTKDDLLFTSVLQTYIDEDSWKGKVSKFICKNFLDQFDPSGEHC